MLNAVSVSDTDDSVPIEETSQDKGANGKEFPTKVREGTSSHSELGNSVLLVDPVQGESQDNAATIHEDLTDVVVASDL